MSLSCTFKNVPLLQAVWVTIVTDKFTIWLPPVVLGLYILPYWTLVSLCNSLSLILFSLVDDVFLVSFLTCHLISSQHGFSILIIISFSFIVMRCLRVTNLKPVSWVLVWLRQIPISSFPMLNDVNLLQNQNPSHIMQKTITIHHVLLKIQTCPTRLNGAMTEFVTRAKASMHKTSSGT